MAEEFCPVLELQTRMVTDQNCTQICCYVKTSISHWQEAFLVHLPRGKGQSVHLLIKPFTKTCTCIHWLWESKNKKWEFKFCFVFGFGFACLPCPELKLSKASGFITVWLFNQSIKKTMTANHQRSSWFPFPASQTKAWLLTLGLTSSCSHPRTTEI